MLRSSVMGSHKELYTPLPLLYFYIHQNFFFLIHRLQCTCVRPSDTSVQCLSHSMRTTRCRKTKVGVSVSPGSSIQLYPARIRLRSATSINYSVPRTRTKFDDRAFSVAGPVVWNSIPAAVPDADTVSSFKRKLKTHFFSMCFDNV